MTIIDDIGQLCITIDSGNGNKIVGRTKLQKIVYFCQYFDWDINDYKLDYYGPYSFGLTNIVRTTENCRFINKTAKMICTYKITNVGNTFLKKFKSDMNKDEKNKTKIKHTEKIVQHLSSWKKRDLELIATIDHVRKNNLFGDDTKGLLKKIHIIKDNYSEKEIKSGHEKLLELCSSYIPKLKNIIVPN